MSNSPALLTPATLSVRIESGPHKGQDFKFSSTTIKVGRDADNDIVLSNDQKVSRQHIEFQFLKGQWTVSNVSNGNHLLVNGEITKGRPLLSNTKIKIGDTLVSVASEAFPLSTISGGHSAPRLPGPIGLVKPNPSKSGYVPPSSSASDSLLAPGSSNRITKIIIAIGGVLAALYFMQPDVKAPGKKTALMKRQEETVLDLKKSEDVIEAINKKKVESKEQVQIQMAQEQFLRGFRDYKQGQYGLAYSELSAALTIYPEHKLARTYYDKARNKFYAKIEVLMTEGKRYRGTNNYRLCKGAFKSAMVMLKVETDPLFKECLQYYNECSEKLEDGNSL